MFAVSLQGVENINTSTIVIASTAVCLVILISYIFLYITERKSYIFFWCFALFLLTIAYGTRYLIINNQPATIYIVINYLTTIGGYWMFFCGTSGFLQKKVSRRWLYIFAVSFLIVIPIRLSGIALSKAAVPLSLTCSCMFFWLAVLVARQEKLMFTRG
jgi:hypothetical protein